MAGDHGVALGLGIGMPQPRRERLQQLRHHRVWRVGLLGVEGDVVPVHRRQAFLVGEHGQQGFGEELVAFHQDGLSGLEQGSDPADVLIVSDLDGLASLLAAPLQGFGFGPLERSVGFDVGVLSIADLFRHQLFSPLLSISPLLSFSPLPAILHSSCSMRQSSVRPGPAWARTVGGIRRGPGSPCES